MAHLSGGSFLLGEAMRKQVITAVLVFMGLLGATMATAQSSTVTVFATNFTDSSGNRVNGTITFQPAMSTGKPASYQKPGGGVAVIKPVSASVVNGAFSLTLPDTTRTNPQNMCFAVGASELYTKTSLLGEGYSCVQPHYTSQQSGDWCDSGQCDFDNYIPGLDPQLQVEVGPTGPTGAPGPTCDGSSPAGYCNLTKTNTDFLNGELSPLGPSYGAKCDGVHDDTTPFQNAANAAHNLYVASGIPVTVKVPSNCVIAGTVTFGSGVHWSGPGQIIVPNQSTPSAHPTFLMNNADNVAVEGIEFKITTPCSGNNATCSAIQWLPTTGDSANHAHVYIRRNDIVNADWGILIGYYGTGTGSLSDVDISDNTVSSPSGAFSNADGIHVGGRVSGITITSNRISWRGDACIALTGEGNGTYMVAGATISGNICSQDLVGIDMSGASDVQITGNFVKNTVASPSTSNPAFREIWYGTAANGGAYPFNIHVSGNYFENNGSVDGLTVKIDPLNYVGQTSWPALQSSFENNTIAGSPGIIYLRGKGISVGNNTFNTAAGGIVVDYDGANGIATANVTIGSNNWMQSGQIRMGAGCALYSNVTVAPQNPLPTSVITYSNLSCVGTPVFSTPGDLNVGSNRWLSTGTNYPVIRPGSSGAFSGVWLDTAGGNAVIIGANGDVNTEGKITSGGTVQGSGFQTGLGVPVITNTANGANIVYRCTSAGTLRVGQLTTVSSDCGAVADTQIRVN
jgi:hypothetical protein